LINSKEYYLICKWDKGENMSNEKKKKIKRKRNLLLKRRLLKKWKKRTL